MVVSVACGIMLACVKCGGLCQADMNMPMEQNPQVVRMPSVWLGRAKAALIQLGVSAVVAAAAAALVLWFWYPAPYRQISGGRDLFFLVVAVDVIIGPLLTFVAYDRRKPSAELTRDLAVIAALQLGALLYGLHTVAQARPAIIALEGDRLRVVRAIDLERADFQKAPPGLQSLSWWGPMFVATRQPTAEEKLETIDRGLAGEDIGMRPEFWLPPALTAAAYARGAKPLTQLTRLQPQRASQVQDAVKRTGVALDELGYLPMLARSTDWSALVHFKDGQIVGYLPVDGF